MLWRRAGDIWPKFEQLNCPLYPRILDPHALRGKEQLFEPKARSSVKKYHFEQKSHFLVLDMEEKGTYSHTHPQYKLKAIFAPIVQACGSSHVVASLHEIVLCFFASAAGASEENLSDVFTILENAMKSASKEMFSTF